MAAPTRKTVYVALDEALTRRQARNPKDHDIDGIVASIRRFGFVEPVIEDSRTGKLIAGHGRLESLEMMRAAGDRAPVGMRSNWSVPVTQGWASKNDMEADAVLVALNRHTERGGWDDPVLAAVLSGLDDELLTVSGFDRGDLDDLLASLAPVAPSTALDGVSVDPSYAERRESYADKQIRSVILDYELATFAWVADVSDEARKKLGVENNADLFVKMLADLTGEVPPS